MHWIDKFRFDTATDLRAEIGRRGLTLSVDDNLTALGAPLSLGDLTLPNRFCTLPMEGRDAAPDGSPGELTLRRYARYAAGGFGLVWMEAAAVAADVRSSPAQLHLHAGNVAAFAGLVAGIRDAARARFSRDVVVILQLSCPEGGAAVTDAYLDRLPDAYVRAARAAAQAGFDGVDVKGCHGDLAAALLAARDRPGRYGGSFANRTRLLRETMARVRESVPELLVTTRLTACDLQRGPNGFGVKVGPADPSDPTDQADLAEPIALARELQAAGLRLLGLSVGESGDEPLAVAARSLATSSAMQQAVPGLPVVGVGYTAFRHLAPHVAAGAIGAGGPALPGLGRGALAYPDMPADVLDSGRADPGKVCLECGACEQLLWDGGRVGCVIRDAGVYGAEYRHGRHFSPDNLRAEAERCHNCAAAPCTAACPTRIDVPGFIRAFAADDAAGAFATIRHANVLPEMCSHLCPTWMLCEGACVERALSGRALPIRDLQYAVCRRAREQGLTGVRVPGDTGRRMAVIGGGPAGVSCAAALLEQGHRVVIIERDGTLGGLPRQVIPAARFPGAGPEIDALLQPALEAGRLEIRFGTELGRDVALAELAAGFDAVCLAVGLWAEHTLGSAPGVVDALTFLRRVKAGELTALPGAVAVLAGGDSAMDAARTAVALGAAPVYVVYGGAQADMHWHMEPGWFRESGAHCLTLTEPLDYVVGDGGSLAGLRICRVNPSRERVEGSESVLAVDTVVEAMGLCVSAAVRQALEGIEFSELNLVQPEGAAGTGLASVFVAGALVNGGASVAQCVAEGMRAAEAMGRAVKTDEA